MKLNFGRRLVLFIHWLLSLALCALGVALFVWPECRAVAARMLDDMTTFIYAIAVLVVYLLFAAGSIGIIFGGRHGNERNFIIVDSSETGRTRIAVGAVDQMIRQAVRSVAGVSEMRSTIHNNEDSVAITVDAAILNGTHVPTVSGNIQRAIRGYIEQNCGVAVRGVNVNVHALADEQQPESRRGRKKKTEVVNNTIPTTVENEPPRAVEPERAPSLEPIAEPVVEPDVQMTRETYVVPEPEPAVEAAAEPEEAAPVAADEPEAPAAEPAQQEAQEEKKPGFFARIFGKRAKKEEAQESALEETPAPEPDATEEACDAPEDAAPEEGGAFEVELPAEDAAEGEEMTEEELPAEDFFADGASEEEAAEEEIIEEEAQKPACGQEEPADEI